MDTSYALSTGLYHTTREYIEYDKKATGFFIGLGKSLLSTGGRMSPIVLRRRQLTTLRQVLLR